MNFDDNYTLKLLYSLAKNQPYRRGLSHVVPDAEFKPAFPVRTQQGFVPLVIPQYNKK